MLGGDAQTLQQNLNKKIPTKNPRHRNNRRRHSSTSASSASLSGSQRRPHHRRHGNQATNDHSESQCSSCRNFHQSQARNHHSDSHRYHDNHHGGYRGNSHSAGHVTDHVPATGGRRPHHSRRRRAASSSAFNHHHHSNTYGGSSSRREGVYNPGILQVYPPLRDDHRNPLHHNSANRGISQIPHQLQTKKPVYKPPQQQKKKKVAKEQHHEKGKPQNKEKGFLKKSWKKIFKKEEKTKKSPKNKPDDDVTSLSLSSSSCDVTNDEDCDDVISHQSSHPSHSYMTSQSVQEGKQLTPRCCMGNPRHRGKYGDSPRHSSCSSNQRREFLGRNSSHHSLANRSAGD